MGPSSGFLSNPPPLHHQHSAGYPQSLEKTLEETNLGVGVGVPMNVAEPREKDLPREPVAMGRNRSGTGKSLKDKKSVFGVLTGEYALPWRHVLTTADLLSKEKAPIISKPYDPIHLTHVGFDFNTGQCECARCG